LAIERGVGEPDDLDAVNALNREGRDTDRVVIGDRVAASAGSIRAVT
jgi:hypothetical protein